MGVQSSSSYFAEIMKCQGVEVCSEVLASFHQDGEKNFGAKIEFETKFWALGMCVRVMANFFEEGKRTYSWWASNLHT